MFVNWSSTAMFHCNGNLWTKATLGLVSLVGCVFVWATCSLIEGEALAATDCKLSCSPQFVRCVSQIGAPPRGPSPATTSGRDWCLRKCPPKITSSYITNFLSITHKVALCPNSAKTIICHCVGIFYLILSLSHQFIMATLFFVCSFCFVFPFPQVCCD